LFGRGMHDKKYWAYYLAVEDGMTNVSVDKLMDILEAMDFPITEFFYPSFLDDVKKEREKWEKGLEAAEQKKKEDPKTK